jgi:hypothetical protein
MSHKKKILIAFFAPPLGFIGTFLLYVAVNLIFGGTHDSVAAVLDIISFMLAVFCILLTIGGVTYGTILLVAGPKKPPDSSQ